MSFLFTSESVSEGHPDKVCDAISDTILDACLKRDPLARTAVETMATTGRVIISGEINTAVPPEKQEIEQLVRETVRRIGYDQTGFSWKNLQIENYLHRQSPDIAAGVDRRGAGDQGIMFGYAKNELGFECDFMPLPIKLAHRILKNLSEARHLGQIPGIEPDSKSQVTVRYNDERQPVGIEKIVVSTQHRNELSLEQIRQIVMPLICRALPENWMPEEQNILINPSGRFVTGGPDGDTGLTGRKIIVDTYGGYAPHGGGAFSGKDATKVDRSAAYMLRYLAKNVVAAGLAEECLLQISYAIGIAEPLSLYINTNRTAKVDEQKILKTLREMTDLTPQGIIRRLKLQNPIYTPTAVYGHFGRQPRPDGCFSWEKLDLVEDLKHAF